MTSYEQGGRTGPQSVPGFRYAEGPLPDLGGAAVAAGLLDVAYVIEPSPVGELLLAATPKGLVRVAYLGSGATDAKRILGDLAARLSPRVLDAPARLDPVRRELEEFFAHRRRTFDWRLTGAGFGRRVLQATGGIPYGGVASYKEIAARAGSPRAYRAAGTALGGNPLSIVVPCHRVLHADGGLGGYTGRIERKRTLLALEGSLSRR